MKRLSKNNFNREFHKIGNKSIVFNQTEIVAQAGHFVQPSSQTSFKNEKLLIICKGYGKQGVQMANELLELLKQSMEALVKQDPKLNKQFDELLGKEMSEELKQRYFVLNLIDSCFEDLSSKSFDGSCSFGIAYIFSTFIQQNSDNSLYLMIQNAKRSESRTHVDSELNFIGLLSLPLLIIQFLNRDNF